MEHKIIDNIYAFILGNSGCSIVDLEDNINGFAGKHILYLDDHEHHYWAGLSKKAINAISALMAEEKVYIQESPDSNSCLALYYPDIPLLKSKSRLRMENGKSLTFKIL